MNGKKFKKQDIVYIGIYLETQWRNIDSENLSEIYNVILIF